MEKAEGFARSTGTPLQAQAAPPATAATPEAALDVACLITLSGGFLDAFTYVGHGHVFANSMTGNVVLLGVAAAAREWGQALRHGPPIIAFLLGAMFAHGLSKRPFRLSSHPAAACLGLEALFLLGASQLPASFPDYWLVLGIAFTAALQYSIFPRVGSYAYSSVMTTANLRRLADGLVLSMDRSQRLEGLSQVRTFGLICFQFLLGAILGAACTTAFGNHSLLVPAMILAFALVLLRRKLRSKYLP